MSWPRALAVVLALVLFALVLRPAGHVYDMPQTEDGYYALAVARNLAAGHGLTIDGVHLTNGFQPLFTILEAGAFWVAQGDEVLAMRLVMALGWLFHVAGAFLIARIARDAWPVREESERELRGGLAALLYLAAPLMFGHAYNGLETGTVMFFYAAVGRWIQTGRDRSWAGLAGLGVLIGLMVLARIDSGFVAAILGLNELRRSWKRGIVIAFARGAALGGTALIVSSPWWIYNTVTFGSPMPTSGTAQQAWGLEWLRFEQAEWALRLVLMPWIFAGAHESDVSLDMPIPFGPGYMTLTAIGLVRTVLVAAVAWLLWRAARRDVFRREIRLAGGDELTRVQRTLEFAACFALGFAGLIAYYTLSFVAYWFYYRYFAPVALAAVVIVALQAARGWADMRLRHGTAIVAGLLALQLTALTGFAMVGRGLGGNTVYHDQVQLVRDNVPAEEFVAAGQAGTLAFFRDRVINTDGKVNRDALAYQDHMWDYLAAHHVRWFVDWPYYVNKYLGVPLDPSANRPLPEANGWRFKAERNYFFLYEYVGDQKR